MSSDNERREIPDDLKVVEQTLAGCVPRAPQLDRDRLMFLAGAASAVGPTDHGQEHRVNAGAKWRAPGVWPSATVAFAATSLALAIVLVARPEPPAQVVYVNRPSATPAPAASPRSVTIQTDQRQLPDVPRASPRAVVAPKVPADNYLRSREVALRMGLDALGSPRSAGNESASAMTYFDWLARLNVADLQPQQPAQSALPKM